MPNQYPDCIECRLNDTVTRDNYEKKTLLIIQGIGRTKANFIFGDWGVVLAKKANPYFVFDLEQK